VVKNLTDVRRSARQRDQHRQDRHLTMNRDDGVVLSDRSWFPSRARATQVRRDPSAAGVPLPDFTRLAYGWSLDSDATCRDDGAVVGDPTEAALVVLAAKLGVDADETRRAYPRLAEVPFDSEYKFMATFHRSRRRREHVIELVKGAPTSCSPAAPPGGPLSGPRCRSTRPGRHRGRQRARWARRACGCWPSPPG
jgi:Ca2+-transporting ATPase